MLLLLHISIALGSVAYTSYLYFAPTSRRFYTAYGLVGLTFLSGSWLVISSHAPILSSCLAGLVYIGAVLTGMVLARRRLASTRIKP